MMLYADGAIEIRMSGSSLSRVINTTARLFDLLYSGERNRHPRLTPSPINLTNAWAASATTAGRETDGDGRRPHIRVEIAEPPRAIGLPPAAR